MLRNKELISPLTLRGSQGRMVRAWDFKQKRNLVIAFLDANCSFCENFVHTLAEHATDLREREAVALLVFPEGLGSPVCVSWPGVIIIGASTDAKGIESFLGQGAFSAPRLMRRGVFVTDRFGEIHDHWLVEGHEFPGIESVLSSLDSVEIACEECGVPHWPEDE